MKKFVEAYLKIIELNADDVIKTSSCDDDRFVCTGDVSTEE